MASDRTWTIERFTSWFAGYHASDEARSRSRAAAQRRGVGDLADDLHHEWYLSVCTTLRRAPDRGGSLPDYLTGEGAATAYALRALDNDAIDLGRRRRREPTTGLGAAEDDGPDDLAAEIDLGIERAQLDGALVAAIDELNGHLRSGTGGCPGCSAEVSVRIALGVVARLRDPSDGATVDLRRGGTTEWDQLVYEVMAAVAPERIGTTEDGRTDARGRQAKRRCGNCARLLLRDLLERHLGTEVP